MARKLRIASRRHKDDSAAFTQQPADNHHQEGESENSLPFVIETAIDADAEEKTHFLWWFAYS